MSSPAERLQLVYQSYKNAYARRADDLKSAMTAEQAQAILDNVDSLESDYLNSARQSLDATGVQVETAFHDAVSAQTFVETAYNEAQEITHKIRAVTGCAEAISGLVSTAAG